MRPRFLPRARLLSGVFLIGLAAKVTQCKKKTECGASGASVQIVGGGRITQPVSDPFGRRTVALGLNSGYCTGVLASDDVLLTAAHCVQNGKVPQRVGFGAQLSRPDALRLVADFAAHPTEDAALVRFSGGLPPGYFAAPMADESVQLNVGDPVVLAGYGGKSIDDTSPRALSRVAVTFVASRRDPVQRPWAQLPFLWFDATKGRGACTGDSGGPAFVLSAGRIVVVGLTQGGENRCGAELNLYTDVRGLRAWFLARFTPKESAFEPGAQEGEASAAPVAAPQSLVVAGPPPPAPSAAPAKKGCE